MKELKTSQMVIKVTEVDNILHCGYRMSWVEGKIGDDKFDLDVGAGAGLGSPWMVFRYRGHNFTVNVNDLVKSFIAIAEETHAE